MCTPFCEDNCPYRGQHNNLIISLVKLQESGKEADIYEWKKLIITTKEMCDLNQPLEDPDPDLRYPLLHWAGTLGKNEGRPMAFKARLHLFKKTSTGKNQFKSGLFYGASFACRIKDDRPAKSIKNLFENS